MSATFPRRPIRRLGPETIERIAAGEVVERPASVVKELVENSLDAGATAVGVRLEDGGLGRIEVEDDGAGIPADELVLAVEAHATSKLDPGGPVERIGSLGFRGEALAAIASVSRFRLWSRAAGAEAGDGVSVVGGVLTGRYSEGRAPGTSVLVEDLFFNTPARRKFLRSPAAEQLEVVRTLERLYLARPTATLRLESEGREVALLPAATRLEDAAARVLGTGFLHDAFPVRGDVPGGAVRGWLGRPAIAGATSGGLFFAVNGRAISSRPLAQAVRTAYAEYLPRGRYPVGVLHLELEGDRVDVNVHPTKREVRFAHERELADALRLRAREGLVGAPQVADVSAELAPRAAPIGSREIVGRRTAGVQGRLDADAPSAARAAVAAAAGHPRLDLLGCVDALYWVAASDDGVVLIDQHAASERVLYETLLAEGGLARQSLVSPVLLTLTAARAATLGEMADAVRAAGFDVEPFGEGAYRVLSVPTYRGRRAPAEALVGLLDELADGGRPTTSGGLAERRAATIACHAAIRGGDVVEPEEFRRVLEALYRLPEASYACPHGRPILLRFSRSRLDRWFLREGAP